MPLTQPMMGLGVRVGGGLPEDLLMHGGSGVRGQLHATRDDAKAAAPSTRLLLIDEEAVPGFIRAPSDAGAGANIVI